MSNDELFKALGMFESGVKKAAVSSAINNVSQEVEQINQQQMGLLEKRQAQTQLANNLALKLSGMGADATTINASVGAIAPAAIKDSADLYSQAMMSGGDEKAVGLANKMQSFETKWQRDSLNQTQAFTGEQNQLNRDNALEIAGLKKTAGASGKPLPAAQLAEIQGIDQTFVEGSDLLAKAQDEKYQKFLGPVGGRDPLGIRSWADSDYDDFRAQTGRFFDTYRKTITGAGATVKELDLLKLNQPVVTDNPANYQKKLKTILTIGQRVKARRIKNAASVGYNVGDLQALSVGDEGVDLNEDGSEKKTDTKGSLQKQKEQEQKKNKFSVDAALQRKIELAKQFPEDPDAKAFLKSVGAK